MVVEVDPSDRVRCQAPGCNHPVYKRIHVVRDSGRIVVLGSECWARLYGLARLERTAEWFGTNDGRRLTSEERAILVANTAEFVARMEAEFAAAEAQAAAHKERAIQAELRAAELDRQRQLDLQRLAVDHAPWVAPEECRRPSSSRTTASNPLEIYRAQQAERAARLAVAHVPALARFSLQQIIGAMIDAKADCIARGVKLDVEGSRQQIELRALELLEGARL